jgi:hypothetical protein
MFRLFLLQFYFFFVIFVIGCLVYISEWFHFQSAILFGKAPLKISKS